MSDDEGGLEPCADDTKELQRILFEERQRNPNQFVSHWELDENDIDEVTEEDKKEDPIKKFLWAAEIGNLKLLDEMIQEDHQLIYARDADGYTALHRAVYEGKKEATKLLLAKGANVNAVTNDGWTALHSSCFWGQIEITDLLLRWKTCDVNAMTTGLQTPLHLAAQNANNLPLFQLLLMHPNINPSGVNQIGERPADIAARNIKYYDLFIISDDSINIL